MKAEGFVEVLERCLTTIHARFDHVDEVLQDITASMGRIEHGMAKMNASLPLPVGT